jgi:predicted O-linked N-acetylglucosamine transferase (SPINDLY family)
MKPAPLQVSWICTPGTTGMAAIDYRFLRYTAAVGEQREKYLTEKVARVRFRGLQPERDAPPVQPLPALAAGRVTFASFNKTSKIGEAVIDLWSRVLHAVPGSRMLVGAAGEPRQVERLRAQFAAGGIGDERLLFRGKVPLAEYLAMHGEVDIVLDSFPYSGGTTSHHALWMGVPVLTLAGDNPQQNQGTVLLAALGLQDWIVHTPEAYVAKAKAAAGDLQALAALRGELRPRMAAHLQAEHAGIARDMDAALQAMWRRWCAGLPPESFTVPA